MKKIKRIMEGYQEFLRQPEIRPLHLDFVERKRAEQLQRQQEKEQQSKRQEAAARQQTERERPVQQDQETVPQRRRSRMC